MHSGSSQEAFRALLEDEDRGWQELHATIESFSPEQAVVPGYYREGWTAKDAIGHIGAWLAAGAAALEQIRAGTFEEPVPARIDELNERFLRSMRDVPLEQIKVQAVAAQTRLLQALAESSMSNATALAWVRKSGPDHYREHLPRLKEWLEELRT
jgi:hypothetical protein